MSNDNAEHSSGADEGMDGLNAADRADTQAILDEIGGDAPKPGDDAAADATGPDGKPADAGTSEEDKTAKDGEADGEADAAKKPEPRREVKLMPAWVHEAEKSNWGKEKQVLMDQIAAAVGKPSTGAEGEGDAKPVSDEALQKEAQRIAEESGLDVETVKSIIVAARGNSGVLPPELVERLQKVDAITAQQEIEAEETRFTNDFDRLIKPLIVAEYGDDVPPEVLSRIKDELHELAYDESGTYSKVPYTILYKGEDRFRDVIPPVKHGAEASRPGQAASAGTEGGKPDLTKPLPESVAASLSNEDWDIYSANMEKWEKEQGKGK